MRNDGGFLLWWDGLRSEMQHVIRQAAQRFLAGAGEEDPTRAEAFQRAQGHGVEVALQVFGRALGEHQRPAALIEKALQFVVERGPRDTAVEQREAGHVQGLRPILLVRLGCGMRLGVPLREQELRGALWRLLEDPAMAAACRRFMELSQPHSIACGKAAQVVERCHREGDARWLKAAS